MTNHVVSTPLADCPYCGKPAKLELDSDHHGGYFSLGCRRDPLGEDTCPGIAVYYTEPIRNLENAVKLWNTRPIEDALKSELSLCQDGNVELLQEKWKHEKEIAQLKAELEDERKKHAEYAHAYRVMAELNDQHLAEIADLRAAFGKLRNDSDKENRL